MRLGPPGCRSACVGPGALGKRDLLAYNVMPSVCEQQQTAACNSVGVKQTVQQGVETKVAFRSSTLPQFCPWSPWASPWASVPMGHSARPARRSSELLIACLPNAVP